MAVKELGHVVLYVQDIERSAAFYRDVLGFRQVVGPEPTRPIAMFSSGRTHHELLLIEVGKDAAPIPKGRRVGLYHIGFKVGDSDEELAEMRDRLEEAGARILGGSDHTMTHSLYLLDPDGNELEVYVDVAGVDWEDLDTLLAPIRPLRLERQS